MRVAKLIDPARVERAVGYAAVFLAGWPGVRRVWLFGGAAKGRRLDWRSDLDFAVEGMEAGDLGRAWSELDQVVDLPVDLVRWESAGPALRAQIGEWGRLLYEERRDGEAVGEPAVAGR